MKISHLIAALQEQLEEFGDLDVISSVDAEGNGYNEVRGADVVYHDGDERIYDSVEEIEDDGYSLEDFKQVALVYV